MMVNDRKIENIGNILSLKQFQSSDAIIGQKICCKTGEFYRKRYQSGVYTIVASEVPGSNIMNPGRRSSKAPDMVVSLLFRQAEFFYGFGDTERTFGFAHV